MLVRLSPSQVATLRRCGLQYFFAYIAHVKLRPFLKLVQGDAVHTAELLVNYMQKIETGEDVPLDVVQDATAERFTSEIAEAIVAEDEDPSRAKDKAVEGVKVYHQNIAPQVQPVLVERPLPIDISDDIKVVQFVDVVTAKSEVRDIKVSSARTNTTSAEGSLQLASYALGYKQLTGELPASVSLDQIVLTKEVKMNEVKTVTPRPKHAEAVYRAAANIVRGIRENPTEFVIPADPTLPGSPCSWCGYSRICSVANPRAAVQWTELVADEYGPDVAKQEAARVMAKELDPRKSDRKWDEDTI